MENQEEREEITVTQEDREKLVKREVVYDISHFVQELMKKGVFDEDFNLFIEEDEEGNMPEICEYWLVTDWLGEQLKARGELALTDFYNLAIWGRKTTGRPVADDGVIGRITQEILVPLTLEEEG